MFNNLQPLSTLRKAQSKMLDRVLKIPLKYDHIGLGRDQIVTVIWFKELYRRFE